MSGRHSAREGVVRRDVMCADDPSRVVDEKHVDGFVQDQRLRSPSLADTSKPDDAPLLVGESTVLRQLARVAGNVAPRRSTVMVLGETGVGKELFARTIHHLSDRGVHGSDGPMVAVDCSTLTESLFESQMFGHVRGAFTGAVRDAVGFFRAAEGGTLFLDEVGELSPAHQAKLLRAIQDRSVTPVGSTTAHPVDVRLVCATHRDLPAMVKRGEFREDLYFRLNVITLDIPPLRERREDIMPLVNHFLASQAALYDEPVKWVDADATAALLGHRWSGNVREVANVAEYLHVMAGPTVTRADLPTQFADETHARIETEFNLDALERRAIERALEQTAGNKTAAARLLGVHVQKLTRRMRKLGVVIASR
ncbi:MAG: sigma 54-interacting transcriptional regulator [Planctomycetota bacterium]